MSGQVSTKSRRSAPPAQSSERGKWQGDQEIEIKFRTDPLELERVLGSKVLKPGASLQVQTLRTIYFDTPSNDLRNNGIVLRVRKIGRANPVLAVKWARSTVSGPFQRKEVEVRAPDLHPKLTSFDKNTAAELNCVIGDHPLGPKFEMQFNRRTTLVRAGRSSIEVAFDDGYINSGKQRLPITEIELELKSGDAIDLYDLALRLVEELPLRLDFVSKAERGFHTLTPDNLAPVKAKPVALHPKMALDDAVVAVVSNALSHFVENWAPLRETEDPEAIHQLRVSLRRMSNALAMFKRIMPCVEFDQLRGDAKRIAAALGPARECDVFRMSAEQGPLLHVDRPNSCDALLSAVEDRRMEAYKDARSLLDSPATTLFVLKVQSFLARRAWHNLNANAELPQLQMTAKEFARSALDRLNARVLKRGKGLPDYSDEARHKLRIALKNLRYGVEFFGDLLGCRRLMQSYLKRVSALQNLLGGHNDVVSAKKFLQQLLAVLGPGAEGASGFILGWYAREAAIVDKDLLKSWKKFKRTETPWS